MGQAMLSEPDVNGTPRMALFVAHVRTSDDALIVVNFANKQGTTITNTTVPNPAQGGGGGG